MAFNIRDLAISGRTIQSQVIQQSGGMTVRLQDKDVTENGNVIADVGYDGLSRVGVNVSGGTSSLEDNKTVSITQNGTVEITPSDTYDGMKKVTATVNVSGGSGQTYYIYGGFASGVGTSDYDVLAITKEPLSPNGGTTEIAYCRQEGFSDLVRTDFKELTYEFHLDSSECTFSSVTFTDGSDTLKCSVDVVIDSGDPSIITIVPDFTLN